MTSIASENLPFSILVLVGVAVMLTSLPALVNILPLTMACVVRAKENIILHDSAKLKRRRNLVALAMIFPFVIICSRYGLYPPAERYAGTVPIDASAIMDSTLVTSAAFFAYLIVRVLCNLVFRGKRINKDAFDCAKEVPYSFFILMSIIIGISIPVLVLFGSDYFYIQKFLTWEILGIYVLCVIRKAQIFVVNRGFFAGFLYLCAVEILPTGMLVASCSFL